MPQPVKFYIVVIAAVVILFIIGAFISVQTVEIGGCKATWYTYTKKVNSTLCPDPNVECDAEPYKQQHNALVDMVMCACSQQSAGNLDTSSKISETYYLMTGMNLTSDQICNGQNLAKWDY